MKRWFTILTVTLFTAGIVTLAGCTPKEEGATEGTEAPAADAAEE